MMNELLFKLLKISGFPSQDPVCDTQSVIDEILEDIARFDLRDFSAGRRIYLIDTAIKAGHLEIVQELSELFIRQGFSDDIRIPSPCNLEVPYRPTFWLASIVTRYKPAAQYQAIETYICERFNIPRVVIFNGCEFTRESYLADITQWKHDKNYRFLYQSSGEAYVPTQPEAHVLPRYRRHDLMDEIESFDPSQLRPVVRR